MKCYPCEEYYSQNISNTIETVRDKKRGCLSGSPGHAKKLCNEKIQFVPVVRPTC